MIKNVILDTDTSYSLTQNRHLITFVNYLDADKIFTDLFKELGD